MSRYRRENLETQVERERSEFFAALNNLDRRSFLKVAAASCAAATAAGATFGSFQPLRFVGAQEENGAASNGGFKVAYISDSHLYVKEKNDRFANALMRAVDDVNAMEEQPDFVFYGGDLAQLGRPEELQLGYDILKELKAPLKIMVGEHDWYYDMGEKWKSLFGEPQWSFDHKGVRFVCLMSVLEEDFWTERGMSPAERMSTVAGLDNRAQRPFQVGEASRKWLEETLADCPDDKPIVVFSHSPLYQLYKDWNFWTEDAEEVQAILSRFDKVTVIHGHTHQLLTNQIDNISFHGLLSTAWPWPYAPQGTPELTVPMNRSDPFNAMDGCGDGEFRVSAEGLVDKVYNIWNRKPILVPAAYVRDGEFRVSAEGLVDKVYNIWNRKPILVPAAYVRDGDESKTPPRPNLPNY